MFPNDVFNQLEAAAPKSLRTWIGLRRRMVGTVLNIVALQEHDVREVSDAGRTTSADLEAKLASLEDSAVRGAGFTPYIERQKTALKNAILEAKRREGAEARREARTAVREAIRAASSLTSVARPMSGCTSRWSWLTVCSIRRARRALYTAAPI